MRSIKIGDFNISDDSLPFFISEVGSNHQGDTDLCKKLILASKNAGASAVKLQKELIKLFILKSYLMNHIIIQIVLLKHMENIENI